MLAVASRKWDGLVRNRDRLWSEGIGEGTHLSTQTIIVPVFPASGLSFQVVHRRSTRYRPGLEQVSGASACPTLNRVAYLQKQELLDLGQIESRYESGNLFRTRTIPLAGG